MILGYGCPRKRTQPLGTYVYLNLASDCSACGRPSCPSGTNLCKRSRTGSIHRTLLLLASAPCPLGHSCVKRPSSGVPGTRAHPRWWLALYLPSEYTLAPMAAWGPTICFGQASVWRQQKANTRVLPFLYILKLFCFQDAGLMMTFLWLMLKPVLARLS